MKSSICKISILLGVLFISSCSKNETDELKQVLVNQPDNEVVLGALNYQFEHRSLLSEFTSTGCPGCGSWGKPTFYKLIADNLDKVVPVAAHIKYGDPMITEISEALAANRTGSFYTPQIWVTNSSIMVLNGGSIDGSASVSKANNLINDAVKSTEIGLAAVLKFQNNKMYTKYGAKLNASLEAGEYYLSSYLMEDGILNNQAGYSGGQATHNYVIRQAANGAFGTAINKEANKELVFESEYTYDSNVKKEQYLVNILWKKIGQIYVPLNAQIVK